MNIEVKFSLHFAYISPFLVDLVPFQGGKVYINVSYI